MSLFARERILWVVSHPKTPDGFSRVRMSAIGGKADVRELPSGCLLIAISGHSALDPFLHRHPKGAQYFKDKTHHRGAAARVFAAVLVLVVLPHLFEAVRVSLMIYLRFGSGTGKSTLAQPSARSGESLQRTRGRSSCILSQGIWLSMPRCQVGERVSGLSKPAA